MSDTYLLNLSAASHKPIFADESMVDQFKKAITAANTTTNSRRFGRTFTFIEKISDTTILVRFSSSTQIIPERAVASCISRQLIDDLTDRQKKEMTASNGSMLSAVIAPAKKDDIEPLTIDELSDEILLKSIVAVAYGSSEKEKELKRYLKNIMLPYANEKIIR